MKKLCPQTTQWLGLIMRRGPLLDCVAHVTRVSPPGVKHQVSVIRICLGILLYFSNSPAHISLSPEQKGPTGLKHFKVTTVQSVVTESEVFARKPSSTGSTGSGSTSTSTGSGANQLSQLIDTRRHICRSTLALILSHPCVANSVWAEGKRSSNGILENLPSSPNLNETVHIGKAHAVRFL